MLRFFVPRFFHVESETEKRINLEDKMPDLSTNDNSNAVVALFSLLVLSSRVAIIAKKKCFMLLHFFFNIFTAVH